MKAKEWKKLYAVQTLTQKKANVVLIISGSSATRDEHFIMIKGPIPIHQGDIKFQICMYLTWSPYLKKKIDITTVEFDKITIILVI